MYSNLIILSSLFLYCNVCGAWQWRRNQNQATSFYVSKFPPDSHSHQREDARVLPSGVTRNFSVPKQIIITTSFKGS